MEKNFGLNMCLTLRIMVFELVPSKIDTAQWIKCWPISQELLVHSALCYMRMDP